MYDLLSLPLYVCPHFAQAGEEMGFTREMATEMAIGTALGSAFLAAESEHDVSLLRQMARGHFLIMPRF